MTSDWKGFLLFFGIVIVLFLGAAINQPTGHSQSAVPQQPPPQEQEKTPSIKTSVLEDNAQAVVLKPKDPDGSVYAISHSAVDPTLWILEEVGEDNMCAKNPLLPARKVGDYCTASFQVNIKDAVCYLDSRHVNTIRCVWPTDVKISKKREKHLKEK